MVMFLLSFVWGSKSAEGGPNPLGHRHEEWICRLVECQAGPRYTRNPQVLLRGCCVPVIDGIFPPVYLPSGSTGKSYSVEFHLT